MQDFDAEKIITMSREELISLLGEEVAQKFVDKLSNGEITYKEFNEMCQSSFPIKQQANIIRNAIFLKLTKVECFNMFECDKEKQRQYSQIADLQEQAQNGTLGKKDLKRLCDIAFGKDSELSQQMQIVFTKFSKVVNQEEVK